MLFDPLECGHCKAFLESGDVSADPLNSLLQWVEEMKATGVTVTWKDAGLQNFVSLNISAHNVDKLAVVALQVFLLRQAETISVKAETVAPVLSPFYQAIAMFKQMGYIVVNVISVSLMSYEGIEGIIDKNISEEAMYPPSVEIKKLSAGLFFFYKFLKTIPVAQKVLAKAEKVKLDRSKLLGAVVGSKAAEYLPDDERCHTGTVKEFQWSVLKDLKNNSKFMKALEKDPVEN